MYLVVDLGNTNKKFALFSKGRMKELVNLPEVSLKTVRQYISERPGITHCILSTVIAYPQSVKRYFEKKFSFIELDEKTHIPLKNHYKTPQTLGKDRLAAAVAGYFRFAGDPVLVVNAGTGITFDLVSANGEYMGGSISPGIQMRLKALHTFTGKLPLISLKKHADLTGNSTSGSILSGVINGSLAEVEGMITRYVQENSKLKVILSGGDLKYFDKRLKIKTFAIPNIVIEGLYQILLLNAGTID